MEEDEQAAAASSMSLPDIVDVVAMSDDTRLVAPATADKPDVKVGQKRKQQDSSTNQLPRLDPLCCHLTQALCAIMASLFDWEASARFDRIPTALL